MDNAKKRKTVHTLVDDDEEEDMTLIEACTRMKESIICYNDWRKYISQVDENDESVVSLVASSYYKSVKPENRFVVPPLFQSFDITRLPTGEISQITDGEKNILRGRNLTKMLALYAFCCSGARVVIWKVGDGDHLEALTIPHGLNVVEGHETKAKKGFHTEVHGVFGMRNYTAVYVPPRLLRETLALSYIGIGDVVQVVKGLNAVAMKEDVSGMNAKSLATAATIIQELNTAENKLSKRSYLKTMLACSVKNLSIVDRVAVFKQSPEFILAYNLDFRCPHSGPAYLKAGNKMINLVSLGDLGDDDEVLMANNIISMSEFRDIKGDVSSFQVISNTAGVGGRKNSRWSEMHGKVVMAAASVRTMLSAISAYNESSGKKSGKVTFAAEEVPDELNDVEI
jgi:hypothetical protein